MKMVKCPMCKGKKEYELEQGGIITPVKCTYCTEGKISWGYFCFLFRKKKTNKI